MVSPPQRPSARSSGSTTTGRTRRLGLVAATLVAMAVALGGAAEASACKPYIPPTAAIHGPIFDESAVMATRVATAVRCDEAEGGRYDQGLLRCHVAVTYALEQGGAAPVTAVGVVIARRGEGLSIRRGDQEIGAPSPDGLALATERLLDGRDHRELMAREFEVALGVGERVEVVFEADFTVELWIDSCGPPSIVRRHHRWGGMTYGDLIVGDKVAGGSALDIDLPRRFDLDRDVVRVDERGLRRVRGAPGRRHLRGAVGPGRWYAFNIVRNRRLVPGGIFVAGGIDLGSGHPRPRLRVGYELATLVPWWIQALAVESDLKALTVVPSTEVASPSVFWIPSFGLGLGAPIRVYPEPRVGVRAQLTLHWLGPFALVGTFDAYPIKGAADDYRGAVMIQVGL